MLCVNNTARTAGVLALESGNYFLQAILVLGACLGVGEGVVSLWRHFVRKSDF